MIKFNSIVASAICLALVLPAASLAQVKKSGKGYLLRCKYRVGDSRKYKLVATASGVPGAAAPMVITGSFQEKVLSVTGKSANIELSSSAMMVGGQPLSQPAKKTFKVDELGNVSGGGGATAYSIHLPKEAIKVGGTWKSGSELPGTMGGGGTATMTYRFNGVKKVGKQSVADITFSISSTGMVKGGSGRAYLSVADSSLASMSMKMTVSNPAGGADLTSTVKIDPAK